jgi:hypothetical protein
VTVNNNAGPLGSCNWNEYEINRLMRNNWRASLVPAAAVIPAPIAYIKVVAVKKLVVGCMTRPGGMSQDSTEWEPSHDAEELQQVGLFTRRPPSYRESEITLKKLECSKQAYDA